MLGKLSSCVLMDREEVEVHLNAKPGQYSATLTGKSLVIKTFIIWLAGPSGKTRAGSIGLSCPLGYTIRTQYSLYIACSGNQPHDKKG